MGKKRYKKTSSTAEKRGKAGGMDLHTVYTHTLHGWHGTYEQEGLGRHILYYFCFVLLEGTGRRAWLVRNAVRGTFGGFLAFDRSLTFSLLLALRLREMNECQSFQ